MHACQTILLGSLSGLQDFLFDVALEGGGQARQLRARSFFISLLAESAALRLLDAVAWSRANLIFSAAGKFLIAGPRLDESSRNAADRVTLEVSKWLFEETGATLRLTISIAEVAPGQPLVPAYDEAQQVLQRAKWQAWKHLLHEQGRWGSSLVLPPLLPPCDLCRRRPGRHREQDDDGYSSLLCDRCFHDAELGRRLPTARWLELLTQPVAGTAQIAGFGVRISATDRPSADARHVFALSGHYPVTDTRIVARRLARHVPRNSAGQPVEFKDLAIQADGTPLLGVLKMDADNLGASFRNSVQNSPNFDGLKCLSERLDDFFARQVDNLLDRPPWNSLYMIFSGGDDLLLVGPWNVAFDFAGHVQQAFATTFAKDALTLSGGLALIKPTFPIRSAADQADSLLNRAKSETAAGASVPKDQFSAFGQVWKWRDYTAVTKTARRIANWVRQGVVPRGWLHAFLDLAEARDHGDGSPVTARLAYRIGRNFPPHHAPGEKGELRRWANALLEDFDTANRPETLLLPAILRHALTATRSKSTDES